MIKISPFKAYRYNPEKVSNIESVVAPPYDIISPQERDELYSRHSYNIIRVILGKEHLDDSESNNKYTRARDFSTCGFQKESLFRIKPPQYTFYPRNFLLEPRGIRNAQVLFVYSMSMPVM